MAGIDVHGEPPEHGGSWHLSGRSRDEGVQSSTRVSTAALGGSLRVEGKVAGSKGAFPSVLSDVLWNQLVPGAEEEVCGS